MRQRKVNVMAGQGLIQILLPSAVKINPFAEKKKNCFWMITAVMPEKQDFTSPPRCLYGAFSSTCRGEKALGLPLHYSKWFLVIIYPLGYCVLLDSLSVPEIKAAEKFVLQFFQRGKTTLMEVWKPFQRMYKPDLAGSDLLTKRAVQLDSEVQETQSLLELHCCLLGTGCLTGFGAKYLQNINVANISPYCLDKEVLGLLVAHYWVPVTCPPFISKNVKL